MQLQIAALSKPGGRDPNEDAFGFWSGTDTWFCVVCDGAGGHGGGDVASKLAVRATLAWFQESPQCTPEAIGAALRFANQSIVERQGNDAQLANMRATAVVLALDTAKGTAGWGHLGDTRLYCFRAGRILARTKDHSIVQRMVDAGYLDEDALRASRQRSRLFRALGDGRELEATVADAAITVQGGDAFLLCSDGFWEYVEDREMEAELAGSPTPEEWLRRLERRVIERGPDGQDNYTALAVWCTHPDPVPGNGAGKTVG